MDLNYLFHRQQVERSRAEAASSEAARMAHEKLADEYERQIEALSGHAFSFPDKDGSPDGDPAGSTGQRQE